MLKQMQKDGEGLEGAIVDHAIWLIKDAWVVRGIARKHGNWRMRSEAKAKAREAGYLMDMVREFR